MSKNILIINDDPVAISLVEEAISASGMKGIFVSSFEDAVREVSRTPIQLIITFIFPSRQAWMRFLSKLLIQSGSNIAVVVDLNATTNVTKNSESIPGVCEVADLSYMSPAFAQTLSRILHTDYSPKLVYDNGALMRELHRANEEHRQQLEVRIDELEARFQKSTEALNQVNEESKTINENLHARNERLVEGSQIFKKETDQIITGQLETIRRNARNLEIIFSNTKEQILVVDKSGCAVFFNKAFSNFIKEGTGSEPILGKKVWDITIPERKELARDLFLKTLQGASTEVEVTGFGRPGSVHLLSYSPVDIQGRIEFITIISSDITERRKQEEDLRRSEENLRAIFENSDDAFTLLDINLNIVAFNESNFKNVLELTGKRLQVGNSVLTTLPPDRVENFQFLINEVRQRGKIKITSRYKSETGDRWFDISIRAVRNNNGDITGYSITSHNCTEMKKAEYEILRLNKSLLNFQNAIQRSSIVSIADPAGNITFVNDNFIKISGYSYNELIGKNHRIVNSGYHPKSFWMNMWKTISQGGIWRNRVRNKAKDGTLYWVDTFIMPFKDEEGKIFQYLSIRNDITSIRNAEEELLQKKLLLQQALRISKMGYYVIDEQTGTVTVSTELLELLNITANQFGAAYNDRKHRLYPDLRKLLDAETLLPSPNEKSEEFRWLKADGTAQWLSRRPKFSMVIGNQGKIVGTIQDVTEQKNVEERLRQYNERFEILSKATNDAIWDLDLRANIIVWSHAIRSTFGYNEENINNTPDWWRTRIHPDDLDRVNSEFDSTLELGRNSWSSVYRFKCADGSYKFVSNRSYILYEKAVAVRAIGALQDITESVKATEEIQKLSLVASQISSGVIILDAEGQIEWVNDSLLRMTRYNFNELAGRKMDLLYGPESDATTVKRITEKIRLRHEVSEEIVNYTRDGGKYWVKVDIVPVFKENGELKNFIAIQTDITELKEYENSITVIAEELSTLIENANVPIFGVDRAGIINEWNNVCRQLFEYRRDEVLGKSFIEIFDTADTQKGFREMIDTALRNVPVSNFELPLVTRRGTHLILLASASPRRSKFKETTGVIFVGQNITELTDYRLNLERKVEERTRDLHLALSKEQELVKLKNQFVSIASHEFRTPLTTISLAAGFIRRYKSGITEKTIDEKVVTIEKQVSHMTYLLDDILVVGKADAGKLPVHLAPMEISPFIRNLAGEVEKAHGSTHRIEIHETLQYREIMSDEKLLRNIVINLFTNAVKFSPASERVDVTVTTEMDELNLVVRDYGVGIPERDRQNIFEPFFRGANVHAIHGTGLGLSIIKKAVDLLKGSITVESREGEGTSFHVTLPI